MQTAELKKLKRQGGGRHYTHARLIREFVTGYENPNSVNALFDRGQTHLRQSVRGARNVLRVGGFGDPTVVFRRGRELAILFRNPAKTEPIILVRLIHVQKIHGLQKQFSSLFRLPVGRINAAEGVHRSSIVLDQL